MHLPAPILVLAAGRDGTWWTHDLDPVLLQITDKLALRWYGLAYLVGALVAWWLMRRFARQGRLPLPPNRVEEFVLYGAFLWMFVGGRIGYCLLYAREILLEDPMYLFRIYEGGMASHGGIIGLAVGVYIWSRRHRVSPLVMYDAVAATAPVGVFLGRVAKLHQR